MMMPDQKRDALQPSMESLPSVENQPEDEEKILEGRTDVNMPALLTKDVQGG